MLILVGNGIAEEGANPALGVSLELLGFAALACFVAYVATTLRAGRAWAVTLALVGGVTTLAVKLGSAAPYLAADHGGLSEDIAAGLIAINGWAFVVSWFPHGLFIIGVALAGLHAARLPRVVAWIGVVIGVACMAAVVVPAAEPFVVPFLLSLLWIIAASVLLVRGELRQRSGVVGRGLTNRARRATETDNRRASRHVIIPGSDVHQRVSSAWPWQRCALPFLERG